MLCSIISSFKDETLNYPCHIATDGTTLFATFKQYSDNKTKVLKFLKKVPVINKLEGFAKKHIGSRDYKEASDFMRKILVEHVNLDITEDVKKIKCPTLLVWGTLDTAVPIKRAYELEKLISTMELIKSICDKAEARLNELLAEMATISAGIEEITPSEKVEV